MKQGDAIPVLILGANRAGRRIAAMLGSDGRFAARIATLDADAQSLARSEGLNAIALPQSSLRDALGRMVAQARAVILTDTAFPVPEVARRAQAEGCHYLDIFESPRSAALLAELAQDIPAPGRAAIAPGCGLAPGHVTALAAELMADAGPEAAMTVFAGVLPEQPQNRLGYANIWGIEGLIEEYTQPCAAIRDGKATLLPPLRADERLEIGGQSYEAFTTAGSIDALAAASVGRIDGLVFKTLRYPGHLDYIRFLMDDLGLSRRIYQLRSLLLTSLPRTEADRVLIAIRLIPRPGAAAEWTTQVLNATKGPGGEVQSAIGTATAAHVCATLDLLTRPDNRYGGFLPPGTILPATLRRSPFFAFLDQGMEVGQPV